ncbi:MAG: cobalt-precorrin-5B (C(1))-methyltransferase [Rhodospirillales bacterium RIFCSPLOWO2_12_FULL_58_28]|nr:MAG: cobalt-precorrin-5B (C(1))-methyltransferase [Rhodospirillales bacterium RIFCSPLOWO2_02_FULL_58_16]OHC78064.1 MAG: cobalt-precorrin-5B (C(1))-methyltransferase [Rhodospirillales bacterium RIFCSPLOWO2_12_FULL_58_28]
MTSSKAKQQAWRKGWTTGACAAAAAAAAYEALITGRFPDPVAITLPKGETPGFALSWCGLEDGRAFAGVIKDAGDDPDVTHGAEIISTVQFGLPGSGITYGAGEGVGVVTLPGLALTVGEPAINPGPRKMIVDAVQAVGARSGRSGNADLLVTISIPGGDKRAQKTMNRRLGIIGGLSILGTTGIVIPYSCSSWIHAIHCGVDVARASHIDHIAAATGRTSEAGARALHGLAETACIEMGDFAGALLKYLRRHPVERLTLAGGFAKMSKLAQGSLDLHSSRSPVDFAALAAMLGELGAAPEQVERSRRANTAAQVLAEARDQGLDLSGLVARRARETALAVLAGGTAVDVAVFDGAGEMTGYADGK